MKVQKNPASEETTQHANSGRESGADAFLQMNLPEESEQVDYHDDVPESIDSAPESMVGGNSADTSAADSYRGLKDDKGNAFDPSLHSSPPEKTPTGRWKRIPKSKREQQQESGESVQPNASNRMEAQKAAGIYHALHAAIFSDNNAVNPAYFNMLTESIEQYYNENGAVEIPAGYNVLLSAGMYTQEMACRERNIDKVKRWSRSAWDFVSGKAKRQKSFDFARKKEDLQKSAEKKSQ